MVRARAGRKEGHRDTTHTVRGLPAQSCNPSQTRIRSSRGLEGNDGNEADAKNPPINYAGDDDNSPAVLRGRGVAGEDCEGSRSARPWSLPWRTRLYPADGTSDNPLKPARGSLALSDPDGIRTSVGISGKALDVLRLDDGHDLALSGTQALLPLLAQERYLQVKRNRRTVSAAEEQAPIWRPALLRIVAWTGEFPLSGSIRLVGQPSRTSASEQSIPAHVSRWMPGPATLSRYRAIAACGIDNFIPNEATLPVHKYISPAQSPMNTTFNFDLLSA
ncbi:hypothetical protein OE88DRAFT_1726896 [Heliocybe sulcata]|uniref:Uncharacterized protein n=1 Tax=Heliocybe sulcata TaxID=5364 RepID=A0A5C3MZP5_9AGAM|nr:hypothetical protein OE88DRAFT_1726896 [Heliocybe sulcata]